MVGVVWIGWRLGVIPLELFVDPVSWAADLGIGLAAGGLLLGLWQTARLLVPSARRLEGLLAEVLGPVEREEVVALALLSGFSEELFFRGAVQGAWGWVVATLLFTFLHVGPGSTYRVWTSFAAVAGLLFAGLVEWRGALLPAIVAHILVNAVGLARLRREARE